MTALIVALTLLTLPALLAGYVLVIATWEFARAPDGDPLFGMLLSALILVACGFLVAAALMYPDAMAAHTHALGGGWEVR